MLHHSHVGSFESILILFSLIGKGVKICVNDEHPSKAPSPIEAEEGIEICVNDEHPLKAPSPIESNEEGIEICVNDEHPLKA